MRQSDVTFLFIMIAGSIWGVSPARAISFPDLLDSYGNLQTIAGTALINGAVNGWQPNMEGGPAVAAELSRPHIAMADWRGHVYIADKDAHAIRVITPDGLIRTLAGTNQAGYNGDGLGTEVQFSEPNGLYTFPNGVTYVLDLGNSLIRKISLDGQVTTVLEDPQGMSAGRGLWVSPDERTIFYSSGTDVRRWTAETGITQYATGFVELGNLGIDPTDHELVVTDRGGHGVYKVFANGTQQLISGNEQTSGGGSGFPALQTGLKEVRGVDFHPEGGYVLATHDGGQVWFVDDDQTIHLLIDGDDDGAHAGDGLPLSTPGRKISETRAVVFAPNGDLLVTEHDGGFIRHVPMLNPWVMGDFDRDRTLDARDIDELSAAVQAGSHPQTLDLDFDGLVSEADRVVWVEQIKRTYFGDATLDGEFNSQDFVQVFQQGEYEDAVVGNSSWGDGDWNGDTEFDTRDFVQAFQSGSYEAGPRAAAAAVPEPTSWMSWSSWVLAAAGSSVRRRLRSRTPVSVR